jgi:hypothetical protein
MLKNMHFFQHFFLPLSKNIVRGKIVREDRPKSGFFLDGNFSFFWKKIFQKKIGEKILLQVKKIYIFQHFLN